MSYELDQVVTLRARFQKISGGLVDPQTVVLRVKTPAGAITDYTYGTDVALEKEATGTYKFDLTLDRAGQWLYRWKSTGQGAGSRKGELIVQDTEI